MRRRDLRQAFGLRIRLLRVEQGWSQEALAERCALDRSYVGSVERGERNVGLLTIGEFAQAFGIGLGELMSGVNWTPPRGRRRG